MPDILISGAGIAGPALAYWLARAGWRPTVVERAERLRVGGHAVDLRGKSVDVIERMGLLEAVRARQTQLTTLSVVRTPGRPTIDLSVSSGRQGSSTRDLEIVRDDLVQILYDATSSDAEYRFGDSIRSLEQEADRVNVTFDSGAERSFDAVIGADGQHSTTRALVFGAEAGHTRLIGAYVSIFTIENYLGLRDVSVIYNRPGRGAAIYTMAGNERCKAILLFRSDPLGVGKDEARQRQVVRDRFWDLGWEAPRILQAMETTSDFYFDDIAQVRMPRWSTGRVALAGDAAYAPSLLSGQGTTLAIVGAQVIAHELSRLPPERAFQAAENTMRPFVDRNQVIAGNGLDTLIPKSRLGIGIRNLALHAAPLFIKLGAGVAGKLEASSNAIDLPRWDPPDPAPAGAATTG